MGDDDHKNLSIGKRIFHGFLEHTVSFLGGMLVFVSLYWFFHFATWHERFIYIVFSILFVCVLIKILPDRPEQ